jgi:quinol monooxygenase YgiN
LGALSRPVLAHQARIADDIDGQDRGERAGVSTFKIRQQTGHASDAMLSRYVRDGRAIPRECSRHSPLTARMTSRPASNWALIERCTDTAAVQAHLKSGHIAALMPKFRECVPETFSVIQLERLE